MGILNKLIDEAENITGKLHGLRLDLIKNQTQMERTKQRFDIAHVELKRIEAKMILEQSQARQSNGQPLVHDVQVKRAIVEDLLSKDPRFIKLMNHIKNYTRSVTRLRTKIDTFKANVAFLESREKILLVKARAS